MLCTKLHCFLQSRDWIPSNGTLGVPLFTMILSQERGKGQKLRGIGGTLSGTTVVFYLILKLTGDICHRSGLHGQRKCIPSS